MDKNEIILALGNALIMMDTIDTHGEKNLSALLGSMQQVRKVYKAVKEEEANENRADS